MAKKSHVVKDPVCGADIKAKDVENRSQTPNQTYYFCSSVCKDKFDANPSQFSGKQVA